MIVSKSTAKQGVKLTAVSRKDSCDLELIISSQYCTSKRALIVKEYPTFKLEVTFTCKGGTYPKGLQLSFKDLPYPKDAYGEICLDKGAVIKIPISGKDYSGQLSVYRMAYMSSNVLGSLRKIRKANDMCVCNIHETHPKPSGSTYTPYTYNNVRKPYRG